MFDRKKDCSEKYSRKWGNQEYKIGKAAGRGFTVLNRVVRKVTEEVTCEQIIKGGEGVSQTGEEFSYQRTC